MIKIKRRMKMTSYTVLILVTLIVMGVVLLSFIVGYLIGSRRAHEKIVTLKSEYEQIIESLNQAVGEANATSAAHFQKNEKLRERLDKMEERLKGLVKVNNDAVRVNEELRTQIDEITEEVEGAKPSKVKFH